MEKKIPPTAETFITIIDPIVEAEFDFDAWQEATKAELEADGMIVTKIEGNKFTGYHYPEHSNQADKS